MVSFATGQLVAGRFDLGSLLGEGGFGRVWRAADIQSGGSVAVKMLHSEFRRHPIALERFRREAEILRELQHDGIAKWIAFEEDPTPFIAIEYVSGETLETHLVERSIRGDFLSIEEVIRVLEAIATPLDHAHSRGVIHRDIKPSNIILCPKGDSTVLKLVDFGVARLRELDAHDRTTIGRVIGSYLYISPEQLRGQPAEIASDVFALASVAFELLTLQRCWARDANKKSIPFDQPPDDEWNPAAAVMARILRDDRPSAVALRPGLRREVDAILGRGLAVSAEIRPGSASEFVAELAEYLQVTKPHHLISDTVSDLKPTDTPRPGDTVVQPRALSGSQAISVPSEAEPRPTVKLKRESRTPVLPPAPPKSDPRMFRAMAGTALVTSVVTLGLARLLFFPTAEAPQIDVGRATEPVTPVSVRAVPSDPRPEPKPEPEPLPAAPKEAPREPAPRPTPKKRTETAAPAAIATVASLDELRDRLTRLEARARRLPEVNASRLVMIELLREKEARSPDASTIDRLELEVTRIEMNSP